METRVEDLKIQKVEGARHIKGFNRPTCDIKNKDNNRVLLEKFVASEDIFNDGGR